MRRGNAAGRHAPFLVLEEQGGFRLSARQAELAGIAGSAPIDFVERANLGAETVVLTSRVASFENPASNSMCTAAGCMRK